MYKITGVGRPMDHSSEAPSPLNLCAYYVIVFILSFSGHAYFSESLVPLTIPLVFFGVVLSLLFGFMAFAQSLRLRIDWLICASFTLFIITAMYSVIVSRDSVLFQRVVGLLAVYIACALVGTVLAGSHLTKIVYRASLHTHLMVIFLAPAFPGFLLSIPYRGMYNTPNEFGTPLSMLFALLFAMLLARIEDSQLPQRQLFTHSTLFYLAMLAFTLVLGMLTYCRGSVYSMLIIVLLSILLGAKRVMFQTRQIAFNNATRRLIVFFLLVIFLVVLIAPVVPLFFRTIGEKQAEVFARRPEDIVGLNRRLQLWETVWNRLTPWGLGREIVFTQRLSAHNAFLSLMDQFGWVPTSCLALVLLLAMFRAWRTSVVRIGDPYRYVPLFAIVSFLLISQVELSMMSASMIAVFCFLNMGRSNKT